MKSDIYFRKAAGRGVVRVEILFPFRKEKKKNVVFCSLRNAEF